MSLNANTALSQTTIPNSCRPIIEECLNIIDAADTAIKAKTYENALQQQSLNTALRANSKLEADLQDARRWYKQPEFVAPITAFLVLALEATLKGGR